MLQRIVTALHFLVVIGLVYLTIMNVGGPGVDNWMIELPVSVLIVVAVGISKDWFKQRLSKRERFNRDAVRDKSLNGRGY